jgi:ABC-type hemin transport system substrate-binding protein
VLVPVIFLGQGLVNAVVEVLVVGEDDVAANIVELVGSRSAQAATIEQQRRLSTYETLGSNVSAGKTTGLIGRVDDEP